MDRIKQKNLDIIDNDKNLRDNISNGREITSATKESEAERLGPRELESGFVRYLDA